MVSIKRYIFFLSLLVMMACEKNEFILEFNLAEDITDNYDATYYATDTHGGLTVQAVASIREGKGELDGLTKKPTLIYITKRNSKLPLVIYADKGDKISVTGDIKVPLNWKVEGNEINEGLSGWRLENEKILEDCNPDSVNMAVARYVEEEPENPVSIILLSCYFKRNIDERGYTELIASLKGEAKNQKWMKIIGRTDYLYPSFSYPARLENMIMRSNEKKNDTLILNNKNPALLIFWQTGYADKKILIDSIKAMEKEFPDSARIISDICLDIDSVGWRNAIRRDSLYKEMKRFWAPTGLTHPTIMKFKVTGVPYFIVFNPDGSQSYRGPELEEAIKDYRRIFNSADTLAK